MFYEDLKDLVTEWSKEAGIAVAYKYDFDNKRITMYTRCPGFFIGFKGDLIDKYRKKLCGLLFTKSCEIKFEEVNGVIA